MKRIFGCLAIALLLQFSSCTKEPGFGGLACIEGKVYAFDYTPNSGIIEAEGYTPDMKVVIAVSGSKQILDETRTDLNGEFRFDELRKGDYEIWTFTECDTCTNNETPVIQKTTISEKDETIVLDDFIINI
jgi:hypothetical protein